MINTLGSRRNGQYFADDSFKRIFFNENVWISIKISKKFILKVPINNIPELVQIIAWRRPGDKPLSEPMMVSLLTHICVTRPQWVLMSGMHDGADACFIWNRCACSFEINITKNDTTDHENSKPFTYLQIDIKTNEQSKLKEGFLR